MRLNFVCFLLPAFTLSGCLPGAAENPYLSTAGILSFVAIPNYNFIEFSPSKAKPGSRTNLKTQVALDQFGGMQMFSDPVLGSPFVSMRSLGPGNFELDVSQNAKPGNFEFQLDQRLSSLNGNKLNFTVDALAPSLSIENNGHLDLSKILSGNLNLALSEPIVSIPNANEIKFIGSSAGSLVVTQIKAIGSEALQITFVGEPNNLGGDLKLWIPSISDEVGNSSGSIELPIHLYRFRSGPSLAIPRRACNASVLPDGRILVTGGTTIAVSGINANLESTEILSLDRKSFTFGAPLYVKRREHASLALPNGEIFVAGGWGPVPPSHPTNNVALDSTEIYTPPEATNPLGSWRMGPNLTEGRERTTASLLQNGEVLVSGGGLSDSVYSTRVEVFNPKTNSVRRLPDFARPRRWHLHLPLGDGRVLVVGGEERPNIPNTTVELIDPIANSIQLINLSLEPRFSGFFIPLGSDRFLIFGGLSQRQLTSVGTIELGVFAVEVLDFKANTVSKLGNLYSHRYLGNSFLFPFGKSGWNISGGREFLNSNAISKSIVNSEVWVAEKSEFLKGIENTVTRVNGCSVSFPNGGGMSFGGRLVSILSSTEEYSSAP